MNEDYDTIVEWRIENFSYWRLELHEKCISSPALPLFSGVTFKVELYPRGFSGNDEYLMVKFTDPDFSSSGDLSFIGPDGSIFCIQETDYEKDEEIPQGPKFMDVFAQIKKSEASHKDQLTLRFRFYQCIKDFEHAILSTAIDVQKVSLKVNQELIGKIESPPKPKLIFRNKDISLKAVIKKVFVEFMLEPQDRVNQCFLVETFTSVVSSDNRPMRKKEQKRVYSNKEKTSWTFSDILPTRLFSERDNAVMLRLDIIQRDMIENFSTKMYNQKKVSTVPKSSSDSVSFSEDSVAVLTREFMCLYQDHEFSDFQLKCGTAAFPVHKNILSARSPVFKRLLSCDMKEATSGCMDIEDLDTSTLALFLAFLYTGIVEDLQGESALKLYYAADKYQVPSLKKECTNYLCANVSISNVCDVLSLADRHQDPDLDAVSRNFVLNNFNEVLRSKEWESFIEGEPLLAVRIVTNFAAKDCVVKKPGS